jgi:hypothetical protein
MSRKPVPHIKSAVGGFERENEKCLSPAISSSFHGALPVKPSASYGNRHAGSCGRANGRLPSEGPEMCLRIRAARRWRYVLPAYHAGKSRWPVADTAVRLICTAFKWEAAIAGRDPSPVTGVRVLCGFQPHALWPCPPCRKKNRAPIPIRAHIGAEPVGRFKAEIRL